jgi:hypothetical protein
MIRVTVTPRGREDIFPIVNEELYKSLGRHGEVTVENTDSDLGDDNVILLVQLELERRVSVIGPSVKDWLRLRSTPDGRPLVVRIVGPDGSLLARAWKQGGGCTWDRVKVASR